MAVPLSNYESWTKRGNDLLISVSGVRGTIPIGLDPENVVPFIRAFLQTTCTSRVKNKKIVIGRDVRPSGIFLQQLIIGTCLAAGIEIIDLGIVPTPTVKFTVREVHANGGIMISASHNPLDWNGFKFIADDGLFFDASKQRQWEQTLQKTNTYTPERAKLKLITRNIYQKNIKLGSYTFADILLERHIDAVLKYIGNISNINNIRSKNYHVVVDAVNGAGSRILPLLLERLGCRVTLLHCDLSKAHKNNFTFPRPPEPNLNSLKKLARMVKQSKAAIGFALDPDADRLVIATPQQGAISEEYTLPFALLGMLPYLIKKNRKGLSGHIVLNRSTSRLCDLICKNHALHLHRAAVGEANVVSLMKKKKAVFGGEGNGGVIVPAIASFGRDPLAGVALILSAMAEVSATSGDDLLQQLPNLFMEKKKYTLGKLNFETIANRLLLEFSGSTVNYQDGLHLSFSDQSWLHVRPSNTEPLVRLIAEALTPVRLNGILNRAHKVLMTKS